MKHTKTTKILIVVLMFGLTNQINFAQSSNLNVTFGKPNPIGDAMNQVQQNANASRIAGANEAEAQASMNAVYNEAMKDNYSKVAIDYLINNSNNYKYVVIENVSGWYPKNNKEDIINILSGAKKYTIIDVSKDYNSRDKEIKKERKIPDDLISNKEVLFLNWIREAQGDINRFTQLSIKNSEGKIVYESTSKNLSSGEILKPLISNYIYSKEQALTKIEELKKYLDLGIITKEEFDLKVSELKPILLGNN